MCTTDSQSKNNNTLTFEEAYTDAPTDQRAHATYFCSLVWIHQAPFGPLHTDTFRYQCKPEKLGT